MQKLRTVVLNSLYRRDFRAACVVLQTMYNRAAMALKREGGEMPSLEERVAYLEGRLEDHTAVVRDLSNEFGRLRAELHAELHDLREDMARHFESIDRRFESIDRRFESIDQRFENIDQRFEGIDGRLESIEGRFQNVGGRFDALDQKVDRHFTWLVGIQVAVLVSVVGALVGSFYK